MNLIRTAEPTTGGLKMNLTGIAIPFVIMLVFLVTGIMLMIIGKNNGIKGMSVLGIITIFVGVFVLMGYIVVSSMGVVGF